MEFVGDDVQAAPILQSIRLDPAEAQRLFDSVSVQIDRFINLLFE